MNRRRHSDGRIHAISERYACGAELYVRAIAEEIVSRTTDKQLQEL